MVTRVRTIDLRCTKAPRLSRSPLDSPMKSGIKTRPKGSGHPLRSVTHAQWRSAPDAALVNN